jgi:endoglucanase
MREGRRERLVLRWLAAAVVLLGVAAGCASGGGGPQEPPYHRPDGPYPVADGLLDPWAQNEALGKGVNFGNLLDAKPNEGSWTNGLVIEESQFALAAAAGFDSVRLPVKFSGHALARWPYTIDPAFMARVEQVVGWGLAHDLRIVITMHHYEEIHLNLQAHRRRFVELWRQIATRFRDAPDGVYFELLNEPNGQLTPEVWSDLVDETLRTIRAIDPHHTIVVGAVNWSNPYGLEGLVLPPEETNAIVTFHYYSPTLFCFQGKDWMGPDWATTGITWPGPPAAPVTPAPGVSEWVRGWIQAYNEEPADFNPAGEPWVQAEIEQAAAWGSENARPLWMSEFTAQDGGDLASRARWISFVRRQLEAQGIPWSFWTLCSDSGTRLYPGCDAASATPELAAALGLTAPE